MADDGDGTMAPLEADEPSQYLRNVTELEELLDNEEEMERFLMDISPVPNWKSRASFAENKIDLNGNFVLDSIPVIDICSSDDEQLEESLLADNEDSVIEKPDQSVCDDTSWSFDESELLHEKSPVLDHSNPECSTNIILSCPSGMSNTVSNDASALDIPDSSQLTISNNLSALSSFSEPTVTSQDLIIFGVKNVSASFLDFNSQKSLLSPSTLKVLASNVLSDSSLFRKKLSEEDYEGKEEIILTRKSDSIILESLDKVDINHKEDDVQKPHKTLCDENLNTIFLCDPDSFDVRSPSPNTEELLLKESGTVSTVVESVKPATQYSPSSPTPPSPRPPVILSLAHSTELADDDEKAACKPTATIPKEDSNSDNLVYEEAEYETYENHESEVYDAECKLPEIFDVESELLEDYDGVTNKEETSIKELPSWAVPWVSTDEAENADNNDPEWNVLRKLESDEERYRVVRKRWRQLEIPNPCRELTINSYNPNPKVDNDPCDSLQSRKRTRSVDPTCEENPSKRRKMLSCTEMFNSRIQMLHEQFDQEASNIRADHQMALKDLSVAQDQEVGRFYYSTAPHHIVQRQMYDVNHRQLQEVADLKLEFDERLRRLSNSKIRNINLLEKAKREVLAFNKFYNDLEISTEDHCYVSELELVQFEETEQMYEIFDEIYSG